MPKYAQTYREFRDHLERLIAQGDEGDHSSFAEHWQRQREYYRGRRAQGFADVWLVKSKLQVSCPKDEAFRIGSVELSGRWKAKSEVWSFPAHAHRLVVELLERCYGSDHIYIKRHRN